MRGMTTSRTSSTTPAAIGIATSAPTSPRSVPGERRDEHERTGDLHGLGHDAGREDVRLDLHVDEHRDEHNKRGDGEAKSAMTVMKIVVMIVPMSGMSVMKKQITAMTNGYGAPTIQSSRPLKTALMNASTTMPLR